MPIIKKKIVKPNWIKLNSWIPEATKIPNNIGLNIITKEIPNIKINIPTLNIKPMENKKRLNIIAPNNAK